MPSSPATVRSATRRPLLVAVALTAVVAVGGATWLIVGTSEDDHDVDPPLQVADDAAVTGPPTSASTGEEGTRTLEVQPDDLPEGLVPEDATEVEGTTARRGDDWSAVVTYVSERDRVMLMASTEEIAAADGYTLRNRNLDDTRAVVIHDGADGSIMTVTYLERGDATIVTAVLVSP